MNEADYVRGKKEAATPPGRVSVAAAGLIFCICFAMSFGYVGAKYLIFYNVPNALDTMSMFEIMWVPWLVFGGTGIAVSTFLEGGLFWAVIFTFILCAISYFL